MSAEAFKRDILPLQDKLYRYTLSIVFDVELAKDIVQEVLMKLWVKKEQLATVKNKEAWCIRISRNLAFDKLKSASRKTVEFDNKVLNLVAEQTPEHYTEQQDLIMAIQDSMQGLTEHQKEIFRLRDLMGYSNKEIKVLMDLNDNQVKVNLFRARQKIKEKLGKLINYGL